MIFKNNKTYDILKYITLRVLPPILTFVVIILTQVESEKTEMVAIIGSAFITMLGQILGISNDNYNKTELINEYDQEEENATEIETDERVDEDV